VRTSVPGGVVASGRAVLTGTFMGVMAGFCGGWADTTLSRGADVMLAVPQLLISIGIVAACSTTKEGCAGGLIKPGLSIVIAVIVLFSWPYVARVVRGNTLSIKEKEFVEASRSIGAGSPRIIGGDVLPNLLAPIIVLATLLVPQSILFEAALSYLGLGVPQDSEEAVRWYRLAADQGHMIAQSNLGSMYANGTGVPEDDAEAVRWYRAAADQGYANSQYMLGFLLEDGKGVTQDLAERATWELFSGAVAAILHRPQEA